MSSVCVGCRSSKVESQCGICEGSVCRKCRIFLSEEEFPFVAGERPEELKHTYYCGACYDQTVEPFKAEYEETLERAKRINIIYTGSKSTMKVLRKAQEEVRVTDMTDRDEAILRLAFYAAKAGDYNAVIEVEVTSEKVRNQGWQKLSWTACGIPSQITSHEMKF